MKLIADAAGERAVTTPDGAQRRVLSYGANLMLAEFTFQPGAVSWEHSHPHEQAGYVVDGEIDFFMAGQPPARLGKGGSYYVPANVLHHIAARTATVLLDAFTPIRADFLPADGREQPS
jgi:quercetin dioxygenase-like cupin family protein